MFGETDDAGFGGFAEPARSSRTATILKFAAAITAVLIIAGSLGGFFYWRSLKSTPQYSLALLIDAARNDDQAAINKLIDTNAAVDDFLPQITAKAIELYGRGLPAQTLSRVERIAEPLLPAIKDKAREELPRLIREKTGKFEHVPFAAMAMGADRYLDIAVNGDDALVKSKLRDHAFEVKMKKSGDRWKIVGVRDEQLATRIAQRIGQEIVAIASNGGTGADPEQLGIRNVGELIKQAQDIFK